MNKIKRIANAVFEYLKKDAKQTYGLLFCTKKDKQRAEDKKSLKSFFDDFSKKVKRKWWKGGSMKKIKNFSLALFLAFGINISNANTFVYDNIHEAQVQALEEAKLMLFFVVSNTCPYCHKLLNDTFNNKAFVDYLKKNFVVAVADLEGNGMIPADLKFNGVTPTTYILTPTGILIGSPIEGAIDSDKLFSLLRGLEEYKKTQLGF